MDKSCGYLFYAAGETSQNGSPEGAISYLDRCICSGPTPDLALLSYVNLHNEIWKAFGLKNRDLNQSGCYRTMAIKAEEANSRALDIAEAYSSRWRFNDMCQRAIEMAENNAFADGGVMREYTEQEKAEVLSQSSKSAKTAWSKDEILLECLRLPWDQQEIFVPGSWDGFSANNNHFPEFVFGKNDQGQPVRFTCNPARLDNGKHNFPNTPHHMEEVYFRPDVLAELCDKNYIHSPCSKDDLLNRGAAKQELRFKEGWELSFIYDGEENVIVTHLGELGRCLPWYLRKHFAEFNVLPTT